ncbi:MAG: bacteriohemerythrin [Desulfuromonadaceae bacterium]|nr:bacteriohemerythrin [Desulfuromonadaceae bacterium]MDD2856118.1 bacteriohemerythrin [Desulfuromonadaceae bacterium]
MGIEWRDSLSIGVEAIDNQHKELLSRFDKLLNACQEGKGIAELKVLLLFLEEYVHTHFRDEEALQKLHRYPEYESHKAEHIYFIEQLKKLKAETDKSGVSTHHVVETNNMLLKWLLNHISKVDTTLGKFLKSEN